MHSHRCDTSPCVLLLQYAACIARCTNVAAADKERLSSRCVWGICCLAWTLPTMSTRLCSTHQVQATKQPFPPVHTGTLWLSSALCCWLAGLGTCCPPSTRWQSSAAAPACPSSAVLGAAAAAAVAEAAAVAWSLLRRSRRYHRSRSRQRWRQGEANPQGTQGGTVSQPLRPPWRPIQRQWRCWWRALGRSRAGRCQAGCSCWTTLRWVGLGPLAGPDCSHCLPGKMPQLSELC